MPSDTRAAAPGAGTPLFSLRLDWLPPAGFVRFLGDPLESTRRMLLPSLSLGLILAAATTRIMRSAMLEVLGRDFVRTARAKGRELYLEAEARTLELSPHVFLLHSAQYAAHGPNVAAYDFFPNGSYIGFRNISLGN